MKPGKTLCEVFITEKAMNRVYITKSKAGHYTVTVKDARHQQVSKVRFIGTLDEARQIAATAK